MNRLILIGNGFDLAHKMETSYYSFILWYLKKTFKASNDQIYEDELVEIRKHKKFLMDELDSTNNIDFFLDFVKSKPQILYDGRNPSGADKIFSLRFKSAFVKNLIDSCKDCRWVDIEQQYYLGVLDILRGTLNSRDKQLHIKRLNDDLEFLKIQLKEFMKTQVVNKDLHFSLSPYAEAITKPIIYKRNVNITKQDIEEITLFNYGVKYSDDEIIPNSIMVLNFNYTSTIENYLNSSFITKKLGYRPSVINIHGSINSDIVFGFGDEVDENYIELEKQNNGEFLRHVKSFAYFKSEDYTNLIRFIESDIYEIYIWGHSCGLSDRTLLNMIFENPKCRSIKIFHHKKSDSENNYTELTQEISRHFKNKQLMRKLIVPFNSNDCMYQY